MPKKERNYGYIGLYASYALSCMSISGFTGVSSYASAGLGIWETIGAIILGSCIASFNSYLSSRVGTDKGRVSLLCQELFLDFEGLLYPS